MNDLGHAEGFCLHLVLASGMHLGYASTFDLCALGGGSCFGLGRGRADLLVQTWRRVLWSDACVVSWSDACAAPWQAGCRL